MTSLLATYRRQIKATIPAVGAWDSFGRAFLNLLLFGLAALSAEWLVHQIEYLIVYGSRFGAIMVGTPHRFYMAPAGVLLGTATLTLLTAAALALQAARTRRRFLLRYLPDRLARHVPSGSLYVPIGAVLRTAPVLAGCQIALYLAQENLESAAAGYGWPGLSVLLAPAHASVVPLHLLAALCSALVLWTIAGWLRRSRHAVQIAEVLAIIVANQDSLPVRLIPAPDHLPDRRPLAGNRGLRSPPLAA